VDEELDRRQAGPCGREDIQRLARLRDGADPVAGAVYLVLLGLFAIMPLLK